MTEYLLTNGGREEGSGRRSVRWIFNDYVILALRLVLAVVFIYAAFQKIGKPLVFADEIEMYEVIGYGPLLYIMAIALPWIELVCGLSLLSGVFLRGSAFILFVLNVVFLAVVAYRTSMLVGREGMNLFEVYFDCGCGFGPTYAWKKLIENTFLLIMSGALLLTPSYRFVLKPARRRS